MTKRIGWGNAIIYESNDGDTVTGFERVGDTIQSLETSPVRLTVKQAHEMAHWLHTIADLIEKEKRGAGR